jgi:hypothetical protein
MCVTIEHELLTIVSIMKPYDAHQDVSIDASPKEEQ